MHLSSSCSPKVVANSFSGILWVLRTLISLLLKARHFKPKSPGPDRPFKATTPVWLSSSSTWGLSSTRGFTTSRRMGFSLSQSSEGWCASSWAFQSSAYSNASASASDAGARNLMKSLTALAASKKLGVGMITKSAMFELWPLLKNNNCHDSNVNFMVAIGYCNTFTADATS